VRSFYFQSKYFIHFNCISISFNFCFCSFEHILSNMTSIYCGVKLFNYRANFLWEDIPSPLNESSLVIQTSSTGIPCSFNSNSLSGSTLCAKDCGTCKRTCDCTCTCIGMSFQCSRQPGNTKRTRNCRLQMST